MILNIFFILLLNQARYYLRCLLARISSRSGSFAFLFRWKREKERIKRRVGGHGVTVTAVIFVVRRLCAQPRGAPCRGPKKFIIRIKAQLQP